MPSPLELLIVAGERSGDTYGAALISEIKGASPDCKFYGIGGEKMHRAGMEIFHDITEMAVVGFVEVIKNFSKFRNIFVEMVRLARDRRPDAVILIDYPGFNLRYAKKLKALGIKVIYYISPQVWAWHKSRVKQIKRNVNKMIVIFPFEEGFYKEHSVDATFVGHPMIDWLKPTMPRDQVCKTLGADPDTKIVGILPGSRENEMNRLLPVMLEAANIIGQKGPEVTFLLPPANDSLKTAAEQLIEECSDKTNIHIWEGDVYDVMSHADAAMVCSGTATLETGCFGTPMVVLYKINPLTYFLAKRLVNVPNIGMINLMAETQIVKELVQKDATPGNIADEILKLLTDQTYHEQLSRKLLDVKERLGLPGASGRAAKEILELIKS
jgi:lipid-A-disaccharide synthase